MRTITSQGGRRGLLIVFEGLDRSGKTTHCQRIVKDLGEEKAKFMRFPDRSTKIGQVINAYLSGGETLDDHVVHLLFSSNRWEKVKELRDTLDAGTHVIVDRYAFSGVAFSAAKEGLSIDWCKQPDRGLPRPDVVYFLNVSQEEANKRAGFGEELYEKAEFQAKVRKNYELLKEDNWQIVNTDNKSLDEVYEEVSALVMAKIDSGKVAEPLESLWPML